MSASLFDRVRSALAPDFRVEEEIGVGGMARVFLGGDTSLDRPVAIKVLRPELATATGAARFLREARILARIDHPNVVPIFRVGEADGLYYYVMAYLEGETLRDRLVTGPLPPDEVASVARDLLAALEAVHAAGIVHRDVKPENVFLAGDRAILTDFGIAKGGVDGESLTRTGHRVGTPGYMPPEQAMDGEAGPRSDIYAAAAVLYEAFTGRRWKFPTDPEEAGWSGVSSSLAPALRKALRPRPAERWPDAAAFRRAVVSGGPSAAARRRAAAAAGAGALVIAGVAGWLVATGGDAPAELAVLPCVASSPEDSLAARRLSLIVSTNLEHLPDFRVVGRAATAFNWWEAARSEGQLEGGEAARALGAERAAHCRLDRAWNGTFEARVRLVDRQGRPRFLRSLWGPGAETPIALADSVTLEILRVVYPRKGLSELGFLALSAHDVRAVSAFLWGLDLFMRDARREAEAHLEEAVRLDPDFTLARWRLADVRRWIPAPPGMDLSRLYREESSRLGPVDSLLLGARVTSPGPDQLRRYEEIVERHPRDAYAILVYGDELFHRGPLWGIPPDSAVRVLELAASRDSFLAPAYDHLVQAHVRLGHREEARRALERLIRITGKDGSAEVYSPVYLRQAWRERFDPERALEGRARLFAAAPDGPGPALLAELARIGGYTMGLPGVQVALGRLLDGDPSAPGPLRATGRTAAAVALVAAGRPGEALVELDSAALLLGEAGRLHAAEWRVVPYALGLDAIPVEEALGPRGAGALEEIAGDTGVDARWRARAAWALGLLAGRRGDGDAARRWRRAVEAAAPDAGTARLARLLAAREAALAGRHGRALEMSAELVAFDSAGRIERPFLRAAVHLLRAEWHARSGAAGDALAALRWHESVDLLGTPEGPAQAGEVDWALGTEARLRAARTALGAGREEEACRNVREVLRLWSAAEAPIRPLREEAHGLAREACAA